jgi:hypothetical protein
MSLMKRADDLAPVNPLLTVNAEATLNRERINSFIVMSDERI